MQAGKLFRLRQFMDERFRSFIIAFDVVIPRGLQSDAQDTMSVLENLANMSCDALLLHSGLAKIAAPILAGKIPFIAKLTTAAVNSPDMTRRVLVDSVEHALSLGASGMAMNLFIGSAYEESMLSNFSEAVIACDRVGVPLLAMVNPMPEYQYDASKLAYVCRVAAELGADVVKTDYPGTPEQFSKVVAACPVPVLIEESPHADDEKGTLLTTLEVIGCGGAGVMFANRVWAQPMPEQLASQIFGMVHNY
jgi:DhnA family fructose-bisphosphate aldolase class Ia